MVDTSAYQRALIHFDQRAEAIRNGGLPTNSELLDGHGFYRDSAELDCQAWLDALYLSEDADWIDLSGKLGGPLKRLRLQFTQKNLETALKIAEAQRASDTATRLLIYFACSGVAAGSANRRLAAIVLGNVRTTDPLQPYRIAVALGLATVHGPSMAAYQKHGMKLLQAAGETLATIKSLPKLQADAGVYDERADFLAAVAEDRAESWQPRGTGSIVVVPSFKSEGTVERVKNRKPYEGIAGATIALARTPDVAVAMRSLTARAPHLTGVFDTILRDVGESSTIRMRPRILVGPPGSGKSWTARLIADVLGVPATIYDAAGSADGSFAGTPAQWSTSGPCEPLRFINACGVANPVIIVDEIEKAGRSIHNGQLHHALLAFLDRGSSARYRDPCLELDVDLSHVNYILTANDLDMVPAPLRDRCQIVRVPSPEWQHVGDLARELVRDIARERDHSPDWYPPLAPDELDVIAKVWGGGSIRQLRAAVVATLDTRSRFMGMH